jgi:hypothetical protein
VGESIITGAHEPEVGVVPELIADEGVRLELLERAPPELDELPLPGVEQVPAP